MPVKITNIFFSGSIIKIIKWEKCLEHYKQGDPKTPNINQLSRISFLLYYLWRTIRWRTAKSMIENILTDLKIFWQTKIEKLNLKRRINHNIFCFYIPMCDSLVMEILYCQTYLLKNFDSLSLLKRPFWANIFKQLNSFC